jgi:hypothetical protein
MPLLEKICSGVPVGRAHASRTEAATALIRARV